MKVIQSSGDIYLLMDMAVKSYLLTLEWASFNQSITIPPTIGINICPDQKARDGQCIHEYCVFEQTQQSHDIFVLRQRTVSGRNIGNKDH